jgi:hypothetical protein
MSKLNYNLANSKPLIPREQNYVLDRKLLTIHSEDRDISKWKQGNHFEIMLPESLLNVQSMRLLEFSLPINLYTFSNQNQNTKLMFSIGSQEYLITIDEGSYTASQLAFELTNKMNQKVSSSYDSFNIFYNSISQKFWFGNNSDAFELNFDKKICYEYVCFDQNDNDIIQQESPALNTNNVQNTNNVWEYYTKWGLPSYLGFEKATYISAQATGNITFDYLGLPPDNIWYSNLQPITQFVKAPLTIKITGDNCIYMMVDKYNSYDELYPYSQTTTCAFNNDYGGRVNSAFAKIPINGEFGGITYDANTLYLQNIYQYEPPIERISKFKFKFRYHDGRLVEFKDIPFDFTIEINSLRNEFGNKYNVRTPSLMNGT